MRKPICRCRSVENDHPYSCPFCSKVFFFFLMMLKLRGMRFVGQILLSLSYLHVLTEILNIMTFESFNKKWRLSCHMEQVHTKIRNFSCSQCDKKFRSDYDLKRHSTTHTGQRLLMYIFLLYFFFYKIIRRNKGGKRVLCPLFYSPPPPPEGKRPRPAHSEKRVE